LIVSCVPAWAGFVRFDRPRVSHGGHRGR